MNKAYYTGISHLHYSIKKGKKLKIFGVDLDFTRHYITIIIGLKRENDCPATNYDIHSLMQCK